jgi:hypothetical protein
MVMQIVNKICEMRLITVLFFSSVWEITSHVALFREKAMLNIFMHMMVVVYGVTSKTRGFYSG